MANGLPNYPYVVEDKDTVRNRMLDSVSEEWDKTEGGFIHDAVAPAATEVTLVQQTAADLLRNAFVAWNSGAYLDAKAAERGVYRREATFAKGLIRITGAPGTIIYGGSRFSNEVDAGGTVDPITFMVDEYTTIPPGGVVDVAATGQNAGVVGNVQAGQIIVNVDRITGVTAVTNPAAFTGGADRETDDTFRIRFLDAVKVPSSSGNIGDYKTWAYAASPLVGRVKVRPLWDGNGTVQVLLADTNLNAATPALVDTVQAYTDPAYKFTRGKADLYAGAGVIDDGAAWKMTYDATVDRLVNVTVLDSLTANPAFNKAGVYRMAASVKVDATTGINDLIEVRAYNATTAAWAKTTKAGTIDAKVLAKASSLSLSYGLVYVDFYWNGSDQITLEVMRVRSDTTTTVWVESIEAVSLFGTSQGAGAAPIGAKVSVMAPQAVVVDVQATLTVNGSYYATDVKAAAEKAIKDYILSLALSATPNVLMGRISNAVFSVAGVEDYSGLQIRANGGAWQTTNITVAEDAMAVPGTLTIS